MPFAPHSPKLGPDNATGRSHWYPYYAGYSPLFVDDMVQHLGLDKRPDAVVLDPWNGSGTTTTVCSQRGILSAGFDLNPAMVVVARARLLDTTVSDSLPPILEALLAAAKDSEIRDGKDPLTAWFTEGTAGRLRAIDRSIRALLVSPQPLFNASKLSALAAFFYVLLFRLVRKSIKRGAVSNPTWVRASFEGNEAIRLTRRELEDELRADLQSIQLLERSSSARRQASAEVATADSRSLPMGAATVDATISSPPYCTRIDYAVATRVELAVLGIGDQSMEELRRAMLGTTLSTATSVDRVALPAGIASLIDRIASHPSKASGSYYRKTTEDYFVKLQASLSEVARVSKPGSSAVLVVQDSYYKDIHIDLASCTSEILRAHGFEFKDRWDFECTRSLRAVGTRLKLKTPPVETVLLLQKAAA